MRYFIVLLLLFIGCGSKPPTVTEVPETLTISTGTGSATLNNTDSKGGSWTQTVNFPTGPGVTYTMSVYPGSTGNFTVTFGTPTAFNYTFGTASGSVASTTSFTSPNVNF